MTDDKVVDEIFQRLSNIEKKVDSMQAGETEEGKLFSDLAKIHNWLPEAFHNGEIGGIVVDEGKARESECKCVPLGKENHLCYSQGIVGALSQDQKQLYCPSPVFVQVSPEFERRTQILHDSTLLCQEKVSNIPADERLEPFMKCLVINAKKQGLEV